MSAHICRSNSSFGDFQCKALFIAIAASYFQCAALTVAAQSQSDDETASTGQVLEEIIVRGIRNSLRSSAELKRNASNIKDAITAEDIGQFPDDNVTEALSRISGVQITRNVGEGAGFTIRGISQNRVEVNGRTTIGRGQGRNATISDIPADLLGGLEVIKSPTADMVEGALGGTVNLKTRRPFDFRKPNINLNVKGVYGSESEEHQPNANLLATDRWDTGIGEMSALVNISYSVNTRREERASFIGWRGRCDFDVDADGVRNNTSIRDELGRHIDCRDDPDDFVYRNNNSTFIDTQRERERRGVVIAFQWQASDDLQFYLDGNYNEFIDNDDRYAIDAGPGGGINFTSLNANSDRIVTDFVRTNRRPIVRSQAIRTESDIFSFALGSEWNFKSWDIKGELGASSGDNFAETFQINSLTVNNTSQVTNSISSSAVSILTTADLTNFDNFQVSSANNNITFNSRDERFARFDADFYLKEDSSFFTSIEFGVRITDEKFERDRVRNRSIDPGGAGPVNVIVTDPSASVLQSLLTVRDISDFLDNVSGSEFPRSFFAIDTTRIFDNRAALREFFGFPTPLTSVPQEEYELKEATQAVYLKLNFANKIFDVPFDGNFGVRYVKTQVDASTQVATAVPGVLAPLTENNDYSNALPSANVRFKLDDTLYLRLAAASSVVRPGFGQLRPAPSINFASGQGTVDFPFNGARGNPKLDPFQATQYDISLEKYFGDGDMASMALYYRDVNAFVQSFAMLGAQIPGILAPDGSLAFIDLRIPVNGDEAKVYGFEVSGQYTFTHLDGWLNGFGVTANYTYSDSEQSGQLSTDSQGRVLPLNGLSEDSFNVSVFYEKYGANARLSWNWRDDFLTNNFTQDGRALYRAAIPQLDFSSSYNFGAGDRYRVFFNVRNILQRENWSYLENKSAIRHLSTEDIQFVLGFRAKFL